MPDSTRNCISFSKPLLAVLLLAFSMALLAGTAVGEGTMIVDLGDDITTQEDKAVTINSLVSYTGTLTPTYGWDFGDGTTSGLQRPSHTYTMAGNYTISLTVTDPDGVTDSDMVYVEVLNVRPIADAGGDKTVSEGTTITFDGSNSWDTASDLPLLTYEWDFGDGTSTTTSKDNKVVTHTYADAGIYVARLVVRDDDWTISNFAQLESKVVTVSGSATGNGTVIFTYGAGGTEPPANGTGGGGGNSTPGDIYWDFGDGGYAQGTNVTHTYESDGVYIATLIITDAFGAMSVHNLIVTVLNSPPTADAGSDVAGDEDEALQFTGSGSDPGGGPLTYDWSFGDGGTATGASVTHAFSLSGTYTVTLTVTDADGLTATDTCTATVTNIGPIAVLTVGSGSEEGDVIPFSGAGTIDSASDLPLLTYAWSFGDGTTGTGTSASHAYADEGTYTVTLMVTDDDGATSSASATVTLTNAAPVASITSVTTGHTDILPEDNVTFTGMGTDKGSTDTLTYKWEFGDGSSATTAVAVHGYTDPGNYTAKFTVTDNDGASTTVTTTVWVKTLATVATSGQDLLDDAPVSAFDKKQDQKLLSEMFDDLLDAIAQNNTNQIESRLHVLMVQIEFKVTDADLRAQLLDLLKNLDDAT